MHYNLFRYTPIILIRRKQLNKQIGFTGSLTFYVDVFFPLSLIRLLQDLTVYMSNTRVSYQKQELLTLREHLSSSPVFSWGPCCLNISIFVLSYYVSLCSEFRVVMFATISTQKRCWIRLYLQLFVEGLMSYY